jgi:hypothetical protein
MLLLLKICTVKVSSYRLLHVLPTARRTSNVRTVTSYVPQDTAEEEHGGHIYSKICSHISAPTPSAIPRNNCSAVVENGWHMKLAIAKPGDVPNTQPLSTRAALDLKTISGANTLTLFVKVGETTTVEIRSRCPICCVSSDTEGLGDFHNHVANHLERIATFALPTGTGDDSDGVSSGDRSESSNSRDMSGLSLPSDASDDSELTSHVDAEIMGIKRGVPVRSGKLRTPHLPIQ